jgi:hypothetical protein
MASYVGDARFLCEKQPKAKIRRCSRMGNFCPHAAASPKSVREYEYIVYSCTIGDDWGGEVYLHFWQISAPPGICLSFETGGKRAKREKNECDGKTTNLVVAKKRAGTD